jgi:hypothetical protein
MRSVLFAATLAGGLATSACALAQTLSNVGSTATAADPKQRQELIINADRAPVREFTHDEAPIVATLTKGTIVYEIRRVTNWIEIAGPKERLGWIEPKWVSVGKEPAQQLPSRPGATYALTAAAIAAIIVQTSRQAYYATGRPCACPDDFTRAGRRCGQNSAYSRPGGARPFCYPSDVPQERIEEYRTTRKPSAAGWEQSTSTSVIRDSAMGPLETCPRGARCDHRLNRASRLR